MKLNSQTGVIEFASNIILRPGMNRNDLLSINVDWEEWEIVENSVISFRTIFKLPNKGMSPKTILIAYVGEESEPLAFWKIAPWDRLDGTQNRPEGKCTKRIRTWFKDMSGITIPLRKEWGHIDASFDPWNQSATIVCNYRERFGLDEEWSQYKRENKY